MYENYTVLRQILSIIVEKKIKRSRGNPSVKRALCAFWGLTANSTRKALCRPKPRHAFFCFSQVLTYLSFFYMIVELKLIIIILEEYNGRS